MTTAAYEDSSERHHKELMAATILAGLVAYRDLRGEGVHGHLATEAVKFADALLAITRKPK